MKVPGLYEFDPEGEEIESNSSKRDSPTLIVNNEFRLYSAIQMAKGLTNNADLSNVKIVRKNSISQGGGKIATKIDFLKLFSEGDQDTNIVLFDGDYIHVGKSENIIKEQLQAINKSNLSPSQMQVYVTGNVPAPGMIIIERGSSLVQAIASAGGKRVWTGQVEYLSFNSDGSSIKRVFPYSPKAKINSYKNPTLSSGDVINVKKTVLGAASDVISEISNPLLSGYGLLKLIGN